MDWFYYALIFATSYALTWALYRYALETKMLDIPNYRSSHVVPTPRGGGLSFVFCFLASVLFLLCYQLLSFSAALVLLGAGFFIAFLGLLDDRFGLSVRWRLLGHFIVCGIAIVGLGGMPEIQFFSWTLQAGFLTNLFAVFYLVWLLNLYNFMDGIDGIAAVEAVSVCLGGVLMYYLLGKANLAVLPLCLAVSVAGFLVWNFPPARIFMGDAGSGFLGLVIGILSIQAASIKANLFWAWLILLGVFVVDATVTLLLRKLRGEVLSEAHCSHAYQHASRYYGKHLFVTLGVLLINLLWLFPIALAVGFDLISGALGLMIAYLPLCFLALKFKAGKRE